MIDRFSTWLRTAFVVGVGLAAPGMAAADVSCPARIEVDQTLAAAVDGWTAGIDKLPTELANISVFDGPPEELVQLIYDDTAETAATETAVWNLPSNPRGYWLTCHYASTTVTLTRRLPSSVTRCEIVLDKNLRFAGGQMVVKSMTCGPSSP